MPLISTTYFKAGSQRTADLSKPIYSYRRLKGAGKSSVKKPKKKKGCRVARTYCCKTPESLKRAPAHEPLANGQLVWHQAPPSFELTCHKFYHRKNKSRTIGLDIEQDFKNRGPGLSTKRHRWRWIDGYSDEKPHLYPFRWASSPFISFHTPIIMFRQRPEVAYWPSRSWRMSYRTQVRIGSMSVSSLTCEWRQAVQIYYYLLWRHGQLSDCQRFTWFYQSR